VAARRPAHDEGARHGGGRRARLSGLPRAGGAGGRRGGNLETTAFQSRPYQFTRAVFALSATRGINTSGIAAMLTKALSVKFISITTLDGPASLAIALAHVGYTHCQRPEADTVLTSRGYR
jgi:hypothetical protein